MCSVFAYYFANKKVRLYHRRRQEPQELPSRQTAMPLANETVERFSGRVEDYVRYRPGYPDAVVNILRTELGLTDQMVIADIGPGPGTSTEIFLRHGFTVIGVEPNLEMRAAANYRLQGYPQFHSVAGSAEATTLDDASVDLVIAAQAFHWFDVPAARREFARILRPPGRVALLWNTMRTNTPFLRDYEDLLQRFGTDYRQVHHKNLSDAVFHSFFAPGWKKSILDNVQPFDLAGVQGRLRSSSFVPAKGQPNFAPMMAEVKRIFEQHQVSGQVIFEYDTELYLGLVEA